MSDCQSPAAIWRVSSSTCRLLLVIASVLWLSACAGPTQLYLMDTPAVYYQAAVDPFAHLDESHHSLDLSVFYATNRKRDINSKDQSSYGNDIDDRLRLGLATVRFGGDGYTWEQLRSDSTAAQRAEPVPLSLDAVQQKLSLDLAAGAIVGEANEVQAFADEVNRELARSDDKEIVIYVHGTKVDFRNAAVLAAELEHFAGRDFVSFAFAWPSHQNILAYADGTDVKRAQASSAALRKLITLLSEKTTARRIHILSYSAGARVASKALNELRGAYAELDAAQLKQRFRIGAAVFAAADVPIDVFLRRLPALSDLSDQVVVTVSDHDPALITAGWVMAGGKRAGMQAAEQAELDLAEQLQLPNFHVVDLSLDQEDRGFDIVGHKYWYRHPWASSDVILLLRTDLPPQQRALTVAQLRGLYFMSDEYPKAVRARAREFLDGSW